ncbi:hypothetical protein STCU_02519 [Strigomonas culicis]|uniref:Uncharacterized protein n=1 Tax=Strigomonas culicis TaxID=28005 RepID=S9U8E4_9TRYP|nr:hypothetical protein STCU_06821 [Strigomonas culicis]EPY33039.1 hypothetical protein STCU_02519 [Strigomonas culicis]|eukprot:EPY25143.1 hypothetical protein STCU_06821 [Strigomonas culicis]
MFCRCTRRLCPATASTFSFSKRFEELKHSSSSPLNGPEYSFMRDRLSDYSALQKAYAVKQTEVERARKAAQMCGLEFTGKMPRKNV